MKIEDIARIVHEANRGVQLATGDVNPSAHWEDAEEWQRESAIHGVKFVLRGGTAIESHEEWCRHKYEQGWVFGPEKNAELKTHPCLVPYVYLPPEQKLKDHVLHYIVNGCKPLLDNGG